MDAVIFDMDGVLIDSEKVSKMAFQKAFDAVGAGFTDEIYYRMLGRSLNNIQNMLTHLLDSNSLAAKIIRMREDEVEAYYHENEVEVKEGIVDFLEFLHGSYKLAVATSAKEEIASRLLDKSGLSRYFSAFTFGSEVKLAKPDPALFTTAAKKISVSPARAYVVEDSESGIIAANVGGFVPVYIPEFESPAMLSSKYHYTRFKNIKEFHQSLL